MWEFPTVATSLGTPLYPSLGTSLLYPHSRYIIRYFITYCVGIPHTVGTSLGTSISIPNPPNDVATVWGFGMDIGVPTVSFK